MQQLLLLYGRYRYFDFIKLLVLKMLALVIVTASCYKINNIQQYYFPNKIEPEYIEDN